MLLLLGVSRPNLPIQSSTVFSGQVTMQSAPVSMHHSVPISMQSVPLNIPVQSVPLNVPTPMQTVASSVKNGPAAVSVHNVPLNVPDPGMPQTIIVPAPSQQNQLRSVKNILN